MKIAALYFRLGFLNKSQISRDFWRQIFDENKIDLRNSDQRNAAVNSFLADPENKKAGWKQADKRFFPTFIRQNNERTRDKRTFKRN